MANPFYLCAYGHVMRISQRTDDPKKAALECFGVSDRVTTLMLQGKSWAYRTMADRTQFIRLLAVKHKRLTGNALEGGGKDIDELIAKTPGPDELKEMVARVLEIEKDYNAGRELLHLKYNKERNELLAKIGSRALFDRIAKTLPNERTPCGEEPKPPESGDVLAEIKPSPETFPQRKHVHILIQLCDGWGHSIIMHLADTMDDAFDWCEARGSVSRYEFGNESMNGLSMNDKGHKFYELTEMEVGGEYKPS